MNLAQATVVVAALDRLTEPLPPDPLYPDRGAEPREIGPQVLAAAEAFLVQACAVHTPRELKAMGEKVLESVAPELYEHDELRRLEREEQRASAATRLALRQRGDGSTDLTARLPDALASRLKSYLHAFTSPRHDAARGEQPSRFEDPTTGRRLPLDRVLGEAFCDFLTATDPARMPLHGGDATRVIVTIDWETLKTNAASPPSATAPRSPPATPAGWPASPRSCPPSSAATPTCWTSATSGGSTPPPSAPPSA